MTHIGKSLTTITVVLVMTIAGCSDTFTGTDDERQPVFDSKAAPGDSARAFLQADQFPVLNVEIDYMEGYQPDSDALDSLKVSLEKHLNKSNINIGIPNSIPAEGQNAYSANDIRALEEEFRNHFTESQSDTVWAYFLIVDGEFSEQNVLGIAYYNTSMAFFGKTIRDISGGATQPSRTKVEGTVYRHEFGHILGLVNNGLPMQQDHQDEAHGHHCTVEECVMYYQVETTDFFSNLFDGNIPEFEHFGQEDMSAAGGR